MESDGFRANETWLEQHTSCLWNRLAPTAMMFHMEAIWLCVLGPRDAPTNGRRTLREARRLRQIPTNITSIQVKKKDRVTQSVSCNLETVCITPSSKRKSSASFLEDVLCAWTLRGSWNDLVAPRRCAPRTHRHRRLEGPVDWIDSWRLPSVAPRAT